jgi:GT2 family glycosyltransferase
MVTPWFGVAAQRTSHAVGAKGTYLTRQPELVARFVQIEYEDRYDRMALDTYIDFVDTYAAAFRRDVFVDSGGFDSSFPVASVEDQELSFRLASSGYRMVFVPRAHVYHWGHARNLWAYARKKFKIGYWKIQVLRHHPHKLWYDSHTPQLLKVQILLVGLAVLCLLGSLFWRPLAWGFGILGFAFVLTTLPFVLKAWSKDHLVAVFSPSLLFLRAFALGIGFAIGLAFHRISGGLGESGGTD